MNIFTLGTTSGLKAKFECNQFDTMQKVRFMIDYLDDRYVISEETDVYPVYVVETDVGVVKGECLLLANVCEFKIPINVTCRPGIFEAQVIFYADSTMKERISTYPFEVEVHKSPIVHGDTQLSDDELKEKVKTAEKAIEDEKTVLNAQYIKDENEWDTQFQAKLDDIVLNGMKKYVEDQKALFSGNDLTTITNKITELQNKLDELTNNDKYVREVVQNG